MGISLQYGLALEGWTDSLLVEKGELTFGSTWHAAGQCPSFIADYTLAKVHAYSNKLYAELKAMTGEATGWHATGGIRFAANRMELDHFRRVEGVAALVGFRMQGAAQAPKRAGLNGRSSDGSAPSRIVEASSAPVLGASVRPSIACPVAT